MAKSSSSGDKIDLTGKQAQFDAFAWLVYKHLRAGDLAWIRVGDPDAGNLDDIQYATNSEIHAFQLRWSGQEQMPRFSYGNVTDLLSEFVTSWRSLKVVHAMEGKALFGHITTNRPATIKDKVPGAPAKAHSFRAFIDNVWIPIKSHQPIVPAWQSAREDFVTKTGLLGQELTDFLEFLSIDLEFHLPEFGQVIGDRREKDDWRDLSGFIQRVLTEKGKRVMLARDELIRGLGWEDRFHTIFNHELFVDPATYQPMTETMAELTTKVDASTGGYIFLEGAPGTGKSSLVTDWAKDRAETVVRYYAFDFTDPNSLQNIPTRGDATTLYFDLVYQLRERKYDGETTLIYRDLPFLESVFRAQVAEMHAKYLSSSEKTIIIIDGLDHVPREYGGALQQFLAHLPKAEALPDGVIIVLGSQSFELSGLPNSVTDLWRKGQRTVNMRGLRKEEVFELIDKSLPGNSLAGSEKLRLFELSNGHPLYLSYLINRIRDTADSGFLENEPGIDGKIENYYGALWHQMEDDTDLTSFLGLIARIRGRINSDFIKEWPFPSRVLHAFKTKAFHLFERSAGDWRFFHNSFRQFLVTMTALHPLDGAFDHDQNGTFHRSLATYYATSKEESPWRKIYHLYAAGDHAAFLAEMTLPAFAQQFRAFRPTHEIREDILLGLRLAEDRRDPYLLTRLLFALEQLSSRTRYTSAIEFVEEFIALDMGREAKGLIREGNKLFVNDATALRASKWFYRMDDQLEAKTLLTLGQPAGMSATGIRLKISNEIRHMIDSLSQWVKAAALLLPTDVLLSRLQVVDVRSDHYDPPAWFSAEWLKRHLLHVASRQLAKAGKWTEVANAIVAFNQAEAPDPAARFDLLNSITHECLHQGDLTRAAEWFAQLKEAASTVTLSDADTLEYVELCYTITGDKDTVKNMVKDIAQPSVVADKDLDDHGSLQPFASRVRLNRILNLLGEHQPINIAVPQAHENNAQIVEFERMLCLITKLDTDRAQELYIGPLRSRILPAIRVYYQPAPKYDLTRMKLDRCAKEYFFYLIGVVAHQAHAQLQELSALFLAEFREHPAKWAVPLRRTILVQLAKEGCDKATISQELSTLEDGLTDEKDVDGRVEECRLQAKAWISLGQSDRALSWMRKALELSLGIGYRKDYQFNYWNTWLRKVNSVDPEHAPSRIQWFAQQLPKIAEMTEGSTLAEASHSLLHTAFEFDFNHGVQQTVSLLGKAMIDYDDAMALCLDAYFRKAKTRAEFELAYSTYVELYLYFESKQDDGVLTAVLDAARRLLTKQDFGEFIDRLVQDINIAVLVINQQGYRQQVAEYLNGHRIPLPIALRGLETVKPTSKSSERLVLKGSEYTAIEEEVVLEKVSSFDNLKELLRQEDPYNSRFSWKNVIDKIKDGMTAKQIEELVEILPAAERHWELFSHLSGCALTLGDRPLAVRLADKALSTSSASGWSKWYDGGSRLAGFQALEAAEPEAGRKRAFAVLIQDMDNAGHYLDMSHSIDQFLPLLTGEVATLRIWAEIETHLSQLFGNPFAEKAEVTTKGPAPISPLFPILWYCCKSPAKMVAEAGKKTIAKHLTTTPSLFDQLKPIEWTTDEDQLIVLDIMTLAVPEGFPSIGELRSSLERMAVSRNLAIRFAAKALLMLIVSPAEIPVPPHRSLSPTFQLHLPSKSDRRRLLDRMDVDWEYLEQLSEETGLNEDGLMLRWQHLLEAVPDRSLLSPDRLKQISAYLQSIDLNYPISTPRSLADHIVWDYLIAELIDGKAVDEDAYFRGRIGFDYDISMMVVPRLKPAFVGRLNTKQYPMYDEKWVEAVATTTRFNETPPQLTPGMIVIGEFSILQDLDWRRAEEIYAMQLTLGTIDTRETDNTSFAILRNCLYEEYRVTDDCPDTPNLVVRNNNNFLNSGLSATWIALNPTIARILGWEYSDQGYFAWEGPEGEKRAESIYWRLGNRYMQNKHDGAEAGEGWFVMLSERGEAEVKSRFPESLTIYKRIQRSINVEGHVFKETTDNMIATWNED